MLNVITTKIIMIKGWEDTLGGDGYVHGLDGSDYFLSVYLSPNSWS